MEPTDRNLEQLGPRRPEVRTKDIGPMVPSGTPIRRDVDFGIVVGVEHYSPLRPLDGAINDALGFHDWLCDPEGGSVAPGRVELLLSDFDGAPQQAQIDQQISTILHAAHGLGDGHAARRLYFYFSGHGAGADENDVALLLARWSAGLERLALSTHRYSGALCGVGVFEEVAMFVDCCRTWPFPAIGLPPVLTGQWEPRSPTQIFEAYATESRQPAYEIPEAQRWGGIFTRCLLSILHQAPVGGLPADELKKRLYKEVQRMSEHCGVAQRPEVRDGFLPESMFGRGRVKQPSLGERLPILARLPALERRLQPGKLAALELNFAKRRGRVVLRESGGWDGRFRVVARHRANDTTWRLQLPVGLYVIEDGGEGPVCIWHNGRRAHVV